MGVKMFAEICFGIGLFGGVVLSPLMLVYLLAYSTNDKTFVEVAHPLAIAYVGILAVGVCGAFLGALP